MDSADAFVHGTERQIENKSFRARHLKSPIGDFKECEGKKKLEKASDHVQNLLKNRQIFFPGGREKPAFQRFVKAFQLFRRKASGFGLRRLVSFDTGYPIKFSLCANLVQFYFHPKSEFCRDEQLRRQYHYSANTAIR